MQVGITMNIDSLGPIDEVNMNFRVDISFRQYWEDSRLNFSLYKENKFFQNLTLSHSFLKRIWVPDTYFPDSLQVCRIHHFCKVTREIHLERGNLAALIMEKMILKFGQPGRLI